MSACSVLPTQPSPDSALTTSSLRQLRKLVVTATDREVVITGRVSSYYLKQLAQEAVRPTLGERLLVNQVEVCPC